MDPQPQDRERLLALLESQHAFPGPYRYRIVLRPDDRSAVVDALTAEVGPDAVLEVTDRPSSKGSYLAVHVLVQMASAEAVLDAYELIQQRPEVLAAM